MSALASFLKTLVGQIIVAFGFAFVSYTGIQMAAESLFEQINVYFNALPEEGLIVITLMRIPDSLNLIASAAIGKAAMNGTSKLIARKS